jgi:hypothetical protein
MFNPQPELQPFDVGGGHTAWVVDNALQDPHALRTLAVQQPGLLQPAPHNAYPGLEWRLPPVLATPLADFFMLHLRARLGGRRTQGMYGRLSLATLQPHELSLSLIHI